jgi:predicted NBD/HSP70 family sugar kinase
LIKLTVEDGMRSYVGLDVSQATTAICVVDEDGRTLAEGKVPTCPRAIAAFVRTQAPPSPTPRKPKPASPHE